MAPGCQMGVPRAVSQRFRGALFGMGAGEQHPALHNADYDFPDALLQPASTLLYRLALRATLHD